MVNAQEWLKRQKKYKNKGKIKQITELDIRGKGLESFLDLADFVNLERLDCSNNQLTSLDLSKCVNLTELWCHDNKFTELDLTSLTQLEIVKCYKNYLTNINYPLSSKKLTYLIISDNNLPEQDLSIFCQFTNLEELGIGGEDEERINQGIYNRFTGSLKPLKKLTKLEWLDIYNTDIDSGLEYLPDSIEEFFYSEVSKISRQLAPYKHDIKTWRKYKKEWEKKKGFNNREIEDWTKAGLKISESGFATYLKQKGYNLSNIEYLTEADKIAELREKYYKAQKWLEEKYPIKESIQELYLNEPELAGELDLADFNYLKRIYISHCVDESRLEIKNAYYDYLDYSEIRSRRELAEVKLGRIPGGKRIQGEAKIIKLKYFANAQKYLNQNYPQEERKYIEKLDLTNLDLEGDLDLEGFSKYGLGVCLIGNPRLGTIENKSKATTIYIGAQVWLNGKYSDKEEIKEIELEKEEQISGELIITDFPRLEKIDVGGNELTQLQINNCFLQSTKRLAELTIANCPKLEKINASGNQLINLDLSANTTLTNLNLGNNKLTQLGLGDNQKLEELDIGSNSFTSDLSVFSHLVNLKNLSLKNNYFTGSLKPLQNLTNLEELDISNTDVSHGLEYLPESLRSFNCGQVKTIEEELRKFGKPESGNFAQILQLWRKDDKLKKDLSKPSKRGFKTNLEGIDIAPLVPLPLLKTFKEGVKLDENYYLNQEISYSRIYEEKDLFLFPIKEVLPIKLYNIKTGKVEWTKNNLKIESYATLSYVWGSMRDKSLLEEIKITYQKESDKEYEEKLIITKWGKKSLIKAVAACKYLGINYLWIDQLCINQQDRKEKAEEVRKMRKCYGDGAVTLVSIQRNINREKGENPSLLEVIEMIIKSSWFKRSWTFQEGWLSKHTIFMFDDELVDGQSLATEWVFNQPAYTEYAKIEIGERGSVKVATPIGWVYYKERYNSNDKVSLSLAQVLRGIKDKERNMSIDGIYSVLGLLPYGEEVPVEYKDRGHSYTQEELLEALFKVLKTAWENGYGEALTWHGEGLSLIPQIEDTSKGSVSIVGGIIAKRKTQNSNFQLEGVEINGTEYIIDNAINKLEKVESGEGFLIDGGLCSQDVQIKIRNKTQIIKLWGTRKSLEKITEGHSLIIPSKNEWESNIPFAVLAEKKGEHYNRLGLVELRGEEEKLQGAEEKKLVISMSDYKLSSQELPLQAQIEVPVDN